MSFSQDDLTKFKGLYIETSRKYLEDMLQAVAKIKQDEKTEELVHSVLIAAHSLAGQSQVAGYKQIAGLSSQIQQVCIEKEEQHLNLDENVLQIENAAKRMLESVEAIEKGGEELDLSEEIKSLQF